MTANLLTEVFAEAAALIDAGWCKGVSAMTADGKPVAFDKPEAVRFCLGGAVTRAAYKCNPSTSRGLNMAAQDAYKAALGIAQARLYKLGVKTSVTNWNDAQADGAPVAGVLRECAAVTP